MSMIDLLGSQQSGRATRGRTPVFRPMIAGLDVDLTVTDASFTFGEGLHDQCTMTVTQAERTTTDGLVDSTISFLFGTAPNTDTFSGYITEVTETSKDSGSLTWSMTIVGASRVMQNSRPRYWSNVTVPSAVQSLAYVNGLGFSSHSHTYVWGSLAQTNQTDWAAAVSLAGRLGWDIYSRYGVVMCYNPLQLFKENGAALTLISESYNIAKTQVDQERSLLEFTPTEQSKTSPTNQGTKVAYFYGTAANVSLQTAVQPGTFPSYRFVTDFVIRNPTEAQVYVDAPTNNPDQWLQKATARVLGNALLYPGLTVDVFTTNTNYYPGKFNGRWLIRAVQHKMDKQSFQTNLILARPDGKTMTYTGSYVPFWSQDHRARPTLTLINNKWQSSWTNPGIGDVIGSGSGSGGTITLDPLR